MKIKDYGYDLSLYPETDEELLKKGKKYQIIGIVFMLVSLFFFVHGGFVTFIVGLILFHKKKTYKKIIAQREFIAQIMQKIEKPTPVEIVPEETTEDIRHKSLSGMRFVDFTTIRKNTVLSKIFPLVIIDVETTGLDKQNDRIIEVSAYKYENNFEPTQRFTTLINPLMPIPKEATAINHITDDMVKDAPRFEQIASQLQSFIDGCNIAGYNVLFDLSFLYMAGIKLPKDILYFDVYDMAKKKINKSQIENYKLQTVCRTLGISTVCAHRISSDCYATGEVMEMLVMSNR